MIFFVLIFQVSSFEYLSAVVHSQDVFTVPHRNLWHPHLYLAKDSQGENYEIRHSSQYYDVSISFLQTEDSVPGVLNCECRFVKEEIEVEEETTFLQVMTPSKVKTKTEEKEKEISIGAYVPKTREKDVKREINTLDRKAEYKTEEYFKEKHETYPNQPEIVVVQGGYTPGYQQVVYTQPIYTQPVFTQPVYTSRSTENPQGVNKGQGGYVLNSPLGVSGQNGYSQTGYVTQENYVGTNSYGTGYSPQGNFAQTGFSQTHNSQGYVQPKEFIQQTAYVHQNSYDQQPVMVQTYSQSSYAPQEYVSGNQQGFVQTKYNQG